MATERPAPLRPWPGRRADWITLADRLLGGVEPHFTGDLSGIALPGAASRHGKASDAMEGFSRTFLLAGFRTAAGDLPATQIAKYRDGLLAGVGVDAAGTWLRPTRASHAIVESASVALGLWLTRAHTWDTYSAREQDAVAAWLEGCALAYRPHNNWRLFGAVVASFLAEVQRPLAQHDELVGGAAQSLDEWDAGAGWISDGSGRAFDYYTAWGFHFYPGVVALLGRDEAAAAALRPRLTDFAGSLASLVDADGAAVYLGRSLTYRWGLVAPLSIGAALDALPYSAAEAGALASRIVGTFLERGAVDEDDLLRRGWFAPSDVVAEPYSGPAASYWASKAFSALLLPDGHDFWSGAGAPVGPTDPHVLGETGLLTAPSQGRATVRVANHGSASPLKAVNLAGGAVEDPQYGRLEYSSDTAPLETATFRSGAFAMRYDGQLTGSANPRPWASGANWASSRSDIVVRGVRPAGGGKAPPTRAIGVADVLTVAEGDWLVHVWRSPSFSARPQVAFAAGATPTERASREASASAGPVAVTRGTVTRAVVGLRNATAARVERANVETAFGKRHLVATVAGLGGRRADEWIVVASYAGADLGASPEEYSALAPRVDVSGADRLEITWGGGGRSTVAWRFGLRVAEEGAAEPTFVEDLEVAATRALPWWRRPALQRARQSLGPIARRVNQAYRRMPGRIAAVGTVAAATVAVAAAVMAALVPAWASLAAVATAVGAAVAVGYGVTLLARHRYELWPHTSARGRLLSLYARRLGARGDGPFDQAMLATRTLAARDVAVFRASHLRYEASELSKALHALEQPGSAAAAAAKKVLGRLDKAQAESFARLLATQRLSEQDLRDAVALIGFLGGRSRLSALDRATQVAYVEALLALGRHEDARAALRQTETRLPWGSWLWADAHHPRVSVDGASEREWLAAVNKPFVAAGLEPVALAAGDGALFARLQCDVAPSGPRDARVTVIVPSFRPTELLEFAVRSITASTWENFEVLVADDGSGPDFAEQYERVERIDPRVRVVHLELNNGTYTVRNELLGLATGEFVTFHDSDDWMHPRRLEAQVGALLAGRDRIANTSRSVRVTPEMEFSHDRALEPKVCEPSLMFRREPVLERVGFYDPMRKAADVEFRQRIEAAFDVEVRTLGTVPLTFQLSTRESLSGQDVRRGWTRLDRRVYYAAARDWHSRSSRALHLDSGAPGRAARGATAAATSVPFYAPAAIRGIEPPRDYDVVFVSHWLESGSLGGTQRSNEEEVRAAAAAGLRVGIAHIDALWHMTRVHNNFSQRAAAMLSEGIADFVDLRDEATARLVMIRFPSTLQFVDAVPSALRASRVAIIDNQGHLESDGHGIRFEYEDVSRNAEAIFGSRPTWIAQGYNIQRVHDDVIAQGERAPFRCPGLLQVDEWSVDRAPRAGREPVIGRYSRDTLDKWPERRRDILAAYGMGGLRVRIMGGSEMIDHHFGRASRAPANWEVLRFGAQDSRAFLASIDFFVHYDHSERHEPFGRSIAEAMASRAVVILPERFRPTFGDGAVYAEPEDAEAVVRALWADPDAYDAQVEKGFEFARQECGYGEYALKLQWLSDGGDWRTDSRG